MAGKLTDFVLGGADESAVVELKCNEAHQSGHPCAPRPPQAGGGLPGLLGLLRQTIHRALVLVERAVLAAEEEAGPVGHQVSYGPADAHAVGARGAGPGPIPPDAHGRRPAWPYWSFRENTFTFRGHTYRLKGISLRLLQCLVEAGPAGASLHDIRGLVWADTSPQLLGGTRRDLVLRRAPSAITALRGKLRALLRLPDKLDPVPYADGAYRLNVPGAIPE